MIPSFFIFFFLIKLDPHSFHFYLFCFEFVNELIFFQFHPSIFDFIIFLYQFGSCSLDCYLFYFEYFFNVNSLFHFHPSIFYWSGFCWLEIWLFGFAFYEIIPTLEPGSWVWNVNSSWLKFFFFMIDFF